MSRFKYLEHAFKNMAIWMTKGDEPVLKLKRYIHRNFELPANLVNIDRVDAADYLLQFGHYYIDALLTYCSDDIKTGSYVHSHSFTHMHTHTHTPLTQVTIS